MNHQKTKFSGIPARVQILRAPRWLMLAFLLPLLAVAGFALAAPVVDPGAAGTLAPPPAVESFEHARIGFNLSGAHVAARCTSCHINNVFKGTPRDCATCHAVGNHMGATAKPVHHVATAVQCDTCHKTTLWTPAFFSHVGIAPGTCGTCHNGTNAKGKADSPTPHPLTNLDCSSCHTTVSFVGAASALPANHLPTTQACSLCHASGYGAGSGLMNHAGITTNCNACHNGQTFAVGMTPKRKQDATVTHMPTSLDCSSCHTSTATFTSVNMTVLPSGHFPTAQPCALCHAAGFGEGSGVMNHAGIANNCVQCHNGQTFAVGAQPKFKPTSPQPHLPTTGSCEVCHATNQTTAGGFAVGVTMNHAGITSNCNACHNGQTFAVGLTPKRKQDAATTHVTTTKDCSVCHNSTATFAGAAGEMPAGHLVSTQPCALCHAGGYGAGSGVMNHSGITSNCASCHSNQTFAVGMKPKSKPANHVPVTSVPNGAACETCHAISQTATGGFAGAPMNHTGITAGCASCHGGTAYAGAPLAKSTNHIPTTAMTNGAKCETCHATNQTGAGGFLVGVQMKHTGITNNCIACHGDTKNYPGALRMKDAVPTHYVTTLDCSSCHTSTTTFKGAGLTTLPTGHLVTTQACSLCHAAGYGAGSGVMNHLGITNNCASCHNGQTFAVGMKPKSKSSLHFPTTAVPNPACETCHSASNTNVGGFDLGAMNHTGITTNCSSCHADGTNYAGAPKRKQDDPTPPHVATASDCNACHTGTTTFKGASGGAMPANHIPTAQPCTLCHAAGYSLTLTVMNHLGITTGCANCHNGQTFVGPQTPMKKPTNHIPYAGNLLGGAGMQCEFCHKSTTAFTLSVTSTVMHNGSLGKGSGQCTGCHLSGTTYLGVKGRKSLTHEAPGHTDCSDSGCHKPLGNEGNAYNSW
jgi:hypothetical protein